jgi:NADPH-dependent 2,4-dienoyl-CoA reductase/sulfur reductase-like enzyme/nitrite reductase/ring-hydroxylating ferredoxin subunit
MSGGSEEDPGPDLAAGVPATDVADGAMLAGHVGDDAVLVARVGGELFAIGAHCTHYHGPLADGLIVGHTVRCPWHHAHFCLRTGEALAAPAIDPVGRWTVEEQGGTITVRARADAPRRAKRSGGPRRVVIAGGGAAGYAAAEMLRREGFDGGLTMLSADAAAPYDRPNCSKDYLAGTAPAEWMPLRDDAWYADHDIELRLGADVASLDTAARTLSLRSGGELPYDALLLALGAEPRRLPLPGFDRADVFTLRSLTDADAIIRAAEGAKRVAVVGASFIALEVAASLRHRGIEVHVAAPEAVPLARVLGDELGGWVRSLHEENGVVFHLGRSIQGWDGARLAMDQGALEADFIVAGTGVAPRTALATAAGLAVDNGVIVDSVLRASAPGVYAAGDLAHFPDPHTGDLIRIEHWVHAERQGQHVARAILGDAAPFTDTPFFWSVHYGSTINYVGHVEGFDAVALDGSLAAQGATARFMKAGSVRAVATVGRDLDSLRAGLALEREAA